MNKTQNNKARIISYNDLVYAITNKVPMIPHVLNNSYGYSGDWINDFIELCEDKSDLNNYPEFNTNLKSGISCVRNYLSDNR